MYMMDQWKLLLPQLNSSRGFWSDPSLNLLLCKINICKFLRKLCYCEHRTVDSKWVSAGLPVSITDFMEVNKDNVVQNQDLEKANVLDELHGKTPSPFSGGKLSSIVHQYGSRLHSLQNQDVELFGRASRHAALQGKTTAQKKQIINSYHDVEFLINSNCLNYTLILPLSNTSKYPNYGKLNTVL